MSWDLAKVEQMLDEAIGIIDEGDPKGRKRLRILRAASELFAKQGYRKTNVGEIADLAGVAKGTVYLYFETKGQIMWSAVALEKKEHLHRFRHVLDPKISGRERLRRLIVHTLTAATQMPLVSRLVADTSELAALYDEIPAALLQQTENMRQEWLGELVQSAAGGRLNEEQASDRVQVLAGVAGLAHKLLDRQIVGALSPKRFAEVLADMLVEGLVPRKGEKK
jgi:AcrR family transcriptional regulator